MTQVVRLNKNGKFKITSNEAWLEFLAGLGKDIDGNTLRKISDDDSESRSRGRNPACIECCGRGNIDYCGTHVALCSDGTSCVIG